MIPPPSRGHLQLIDAREPVEVNPLIPLTLHHLSDQSVGDVRRWLLRLYPAHHPATLRRGDGSTRQISVGELDRQTSLGSETMLDVPPLSPEEAAGSPFVLRGIVHRLRAPGGCPWDRKQTPRSLARFVLEEAYEVVEAIEAGDPAALREELGDLLLQVYLQAEIAEESGDFDIGDVIRGLVGKLIRRHPHVFRDVEVAGAEEVERNWESLKRAEKGAERSILDDLPRHRPALARAQEMQRRLIQAGFDWPDRRSVLAKLAEELHELSAALDDPAALSGELGDALFMLARLATDAGIDAETALSGALERIRSRFSYVEQQARTRGLPLRALPVDELLRLWEEAKTRERAGTGTSAAE